MAHHACCVGVKEPRVTSLPSCASGGRIHVCPQAYVDTKSRSVAFGVGVYMYCFAIRGRGVENPQGFGLENR